LAFKQVFQDASSGACICLSYSFDNKCSESMMQTKILITAETEYSFQRSIQR